MIPNRAPATEAQASAISRWTDKDGPKSTFHAKLARLATPPVLERVIAGVLDFGSEDDIPTGAVCDVTKDESSWTSRSKNEPEHQG